MASRMERWLLGSLTALVISSAGAVAGCDGGSKWEHPNRERYPAPPSDDEIVMSLEDLEEKWAKEDKRAGRLPTAGAAAEERQPRSAALDRALSRIRRALDAAADEATTARDEPGGEPLGGGPQDGARSLDRLTD